MKKLFGALAFICVLALAGTALAATPAAPQAGKPVQDKPEKGVDRVTLISVQIEGDDSIGARRCNDLDAFHRRCDNRSDWYTHNWPCRGCDLRQCRAGREQNTQRKNAAIAKV